MKYLIFSILLCSITFPAISATYDRNKAVAVERVIFGSVHSIRNITQQEIIKDKNANWRTFGGALIGGVIGNQFGSGHGKDAATILGAIAGGAIARNQGRDEVITLQLVELMITAEDGTQYMVIQDYDQSMVFQRNDAIRLIYLVNGGVRVDKEF